MNKKIVLSIIASMITTVVNANDTLDLGTVTVTTATKSKQSLKDVTSKVEVITKEELEEKHITTVGEALNLISGIDIVSNGGIGSSSNLYLRGMATNRTLILIDGIRYQDPSNTNGANIAHLLVNNIEKIEIIKGAQSGIWGADASAGVINIITSSPQKGTNENLTLESGSFKTKKASLVLSQKNDKFDIQLSATKLSSNSFTTQAPRGDDIDKYEDDPYKNSTINLKAGINLTKKDRIVLNIFDIDAKKDYDSYNNPDDNTMKSNIDTKLYNLSYYHRSQKHNITIKAEQSKFEREEEGTTWGVKNFDGKNKNFEIKDNIILNEDNSFIVGTGKSSDEAKYQKTDNTEKEQTNNNKFVYFTYLKNLENIKLTASLRHDNYDNFDNKTTGKIGIKYDINSNLYLKTNYATGYNVPNIIQELNPWGATNKDLKPENTKSYDFTVGYNNLKITYFHNKVYDLIQWYDPTPTNWFNNDAIYKNLDGKNILKGIELSYTKQVLQDTFISLNYTTLSAKDKDGQDLAKRAKEMLKIGIDYYGINKIDINLNADYTGERWDDTAKTKQTGKYTVINTTINYDLKPSTKLYLKIENLTDKYYQTTDGYATSPRAFYVGIKSKF